jgi:enoyl-CoA hydratase
MTLAGTKLGLDLLERGTDAIDPQGQYVEAFHAAWASDDLVEGRRAFGERRPAQFEGR